MKPEIIVPSFLIVIAGIVAIAAMSLPNLEKETRTGAMNLSGIAIAGASGLAQSKSDASATLSRRKVSIRSNSPDE